MTSSASPSLPAKHLQALDSIRFICAAIVVVGHVGIIPPHSLDGSLAGKLIGSLLGVMFNGQAAVIVFFVLSGFVIHYPQSSGRRLTLAPFYMRRLIRIGIPAIAAIILYQVLDVPMGAPTFGVLWSIICEVIYYLLYPLLLTLSYRVSWRNLVIAASLIALCFALANWSVLQRDQDYPSFGLWTWVVGLPCWLLGCWLAENFHRFPELGRLQIWAVRLAIYGTSVALCILKFHWLKASNVYMLNLMAFAVTAWIALEVQYFRERKPNALLEWSGGWSYSLYLVHPIAVTLTVSIATTFIHSPIAIALSVILSLAFFFVIERPAHALAKRVGRAAEANRRSALPENA